MKHHLFILPTLRETEWIACIFFLNVLSFCNCLYGWDHIIDMFWGSDFCLLMFFLIAIKKFKIVSIIVLKFSYEFTESDSLFQYQSFPYICTFRLHLSFQYYQWCWNLLLCWWNIYSFKFKGYKYLQVLDKCHKIAFEKYKSI